MLFKTLPDISILCVIGTVPDYVQGVIKLIWVFSGMGKKPESRAIQALPSE